jgi:hypothetical protein
MIVTVRYDWYGGQPNNATQATQCERYPKRMGECHAERTSKQCSATEYHGHQLNERCEDFVYGHIIFCLAWVSYQLI